jgi:hypothetical protein
MAVEQLEQSRAFQQFRRSLFWPVNTAVWGHARP